jgi:hypothetical protein
MRVVEDRADRLVAWLAPRTEIMYWALPDGRDPRVVPLGERFRTPLTTAARRWQGAGVPPGDPDAIDLPGAAFLG